MIFIKFLFIKIAIDNAEKKFLKLSRATRKAVGWPDLLELAVAWRVSVKFLQR